MYSSLPKIFVYILIFFSFLLNFNAYSANQKILYSRKSISNYFSGIISSNNNNNKLALKYLNNLNHLKDNHDQFNRELVFTLVQTQKIPELFSYLKKLRKKNSNFFDANLLLGISYLLEKNYMKSSSYFNSIIQTKKFSNREKLIAQSLLSYAKVFENRLHDYKTELNIISKNYKNFALINNAFMSCYLDNKNVDENFLRIINPDTLNFTRYNFFYINFLVSKNRHNEALKVLKKNNDVFNTNLLLDQTKSWLKKGKTNKVKDIFNCRNPNHLISEFFYLIANLHSGDENYALSNFYLNLSLYLNPDFIFNNALLAENYFYLKDYQNSKKIYLKFDSKNQIYSWHAKKRLVWIKIKIENDKSAINFLNKSFKKLKNPTVKNYYDLANLFKDFEKYEDSIKYYTKVLNGISNDNPLYSKILYKRGVSYERLKLWKKSESDLIQSLNLVPEEPYVLNYLAYSWLERNINLEKSIEMLKIAFNKKKEDPYIIDSLGWGMYLTGRYEEAEKLLQKAVQLMPLDPIVNDHYADILWKLNKNLQANYFWNYVLNLETTENEMKDKIKAKLILGVQNHS
jgi:tetratricopeptide (TPR) repeat protein